MGLDTSHDCWHGAYSAFMRWREKLAEVVGIPLPLMEGFYAPPIRDVLSWAAPREGGPMCGDYRGPVLYHWINEASRWLPLRWTALRRDVLHVLLNHSDCEGIIAHEHCARLADRLEELLPLLDGDGGGQVGSYREKTGRFIDGLRRAAAAGEDVVFH